ncbi:MAG: protein kinase [Pyrinomonadaceae bacterium]
MTPERWQKIEEIFHEVLELDGGERTEFLKSRTDKDIELKAEVEKLLSQFEKASGFIEQPMYDREKNALLLTLFDESDADPIIGQILGNYRIEREIGRGGMGAVYEAERADGEFRLRVALKVVKRGIDTDFVLRRFRNERQILAALDHPFITRLIDGGTTPDGRPYFVMDLIDGMPLYRYCDKNKLSIIDRLRLFCRVCEAVQHAHEKQVIHRDLKPSNIFIANDGTPRLLDFGIAKLLDPEMASDTLQPTATALRMMTIDYASPEQVRGEKVTYSTDVYSLGVVLYELLTECRPYQISSRAPHDIARAVCDSEPLLPSDVMSGKVEGVAVIVSKSANTLVGLFDTNERREQASHEVRGNLDSILMKTLEKKPSNRYGSVADLFADIGSHLAGKTVEAPQYISKGKAEPIPSSIKNARLLAVLPLKLLNFSATENTDENYLSIGLADAIISRLTSVRDFTVRPTSSISDYEKNDTDPLQAGRELGVDFVLDGRIKKFGEKLRISLQMLDVQKASTVWAGQFDEKFTDVLTLEDAISEQVADALVSQVTGENRVQLGKRGTDNPNAYEAYLKGRFYWNQFTADSLPKAIEQFQKAVEIDSNYALAHVGVADFYIWADIYGLIPSLEATKLAEEAIEKALAIDPQLGEAYATLGLIKQNRFQWHESELLYPKAIELNPNYPNAHEWHAAILTGIGKTDEGIREIERAEELDPLSLRTKTMVAWTKCQAHKFDDALAKADEIISLDKNFPQGHLQRGYALIELGRGAEAVTEIETAMSLMPESPLLKFNLACAFAAAGRCADARQVFAEMKSDAAKGYVKPMFLGYAAVAADKIDEAFKYFEQAVDEFEPWLVWFGTDLKLEPIRNDKRYLELMRRTKNPMLQRFADRTAQTEKWSIAVLPLQILGTPTGSLDDEFLGVGLADAMITRLSQVRRIVVRPTSSVLKYSSYDDVFSVGGELNVDFILCGTLRRVGERVRVSAQLLEVAGKSTVWAEKFDENFTDVLDLEDIVSEKVARLLIPQLTGEEQQKLAKRGTDKPEAYEAYLKGRTNWLNSTPEGFAKALVCFNEAIAIDPNYAAPHAGIADYHNFLSIFGLMAPRECFPAAKESAKKALELDPELGEAYVSLAMTAYSYEWNFEKCDRLFLKALDLIPNSVAAHMWYAHFLSLMGRNNEAIYHVGRADDIAPSNYSTFIIHAFVLRNARRYVESRQKLIEAHNLQPGHYLAMQAHSWNVLVLENYDEAMRECLKAVAADTGLNMSSNALAFVLAAEGKRDESLEIANKLIDIRKKTYVPPCYMAQIFTALGDKDRAFEWFETGYEERDCWTPWLAADPRFDVLRDDPRYFDLLKRIGISDNSRTVAR